MQFPIKETLQQLPNNIRQGDAYTYGSKLATGSAEANKAYKLICPGLTNKDKDNKALAFLEQWWLPINGTRELQEAPRAVSPAPHAAVHQPLTHLQAFNGASAVFEAQLLYVLLTCRLQMCWLCLCL